MKEIASSPAWLRPVILKVTRPQPGIERLSLLPTTSFTKADRVAGIDGLQPFQLLETGGGADTRDRKSGRFALGPLPLPMADIELHPDRLRVPAGGEEPAEMALRRGVLVEVEGLRIEGLREAFDLLGGEGVRADLVARADLQVLEEIHAPNSAARS